MLIGTLTDHKHQHLHPWPRFPPEAGVRLNPTQTPVCKKATDIPVKESKIERKIGGIIINFSLIK